jgi:hypothetical protein
MTKTLTAIAGLALAAVATLAAAGAITPAEALLAFFIPCLPAQNVVANGKATINFANLLGYTVEYILLELGGTALTKAMLTDIDIKANAKTIIKDTGANMDSRMQYRGETANAAYLVIAFDESRARCEVRGRSKDGALNVVDGEKIGALDTTFGIQQFTGEITIAGATAPTLNAYAELSAAPAADDRFRGLIGKALNFTVSPAAAGTFPFDVPYGRQKGAIVKRIFLIGSTVTGYEVKKNGITIMRSNSVALNNYTQTREGRAPQSNIQVIDFIKDGNQTAALNAFDANTMEYYMTVSGAGNVTVLVELYDLLNNN